MPIEAVVAGDLVWARDEHTGESGWKRVLETFVTHPTEIYRLTYRMRGPPGSASAGGPTSETLGVTGPHPFWVASRPTPGFFPAQELRPGDQLALASGGSAEVTSIRLESAPAGRSLATHNFEVADFHTYFAGCAGVWVHNLSKFLCEEGHAALKALQRAEGIADDALLGRRLELGKKLLTSGAKYSAKDASFLTHALTYDEFAEYAAKYGSASAPGAELFRLKTYSELDGLLKGFGPRPFDLHHVVEKKFQDLLGLPGGAAQDLVPAIPLPKRPGYGGFDAAEYAANFGHPPVFHQGSVAEGSLVQALAQVRNEFPGGTPTPELKSALLIRLQQVYESAPYQKLNLWPIARDWLRTQAQHLPGVIIPN